LLAAAQVGPQVAVEERGVTKQTPFLLLLAVRIPFLLALVEWQQTAFLDQEITAYFPLSPVLVVAVLVVLELTARVAVLVVVLAVMISLKLAVAAHLGRAIMVEMHQLGMLAAEAALTLLEGMVRDKLVGQVGRV
jgi:hypothetical protein